MKYMQRHMARAHTAFLRGLNMPSATAGGSLLCQGVDWDRCTAAWAPKSLHLSRQGLRDPG